MALLLDKNVVTGKHTLDDVQETVSSSYVFLKQMLENDLEVKVVSWDSEDLYRSSLSQCSEDNYEPLEKYLEYLSDFRSEYDFLWK